MVGVVTVASSRAKARRWVAAVLAGVLAVPLGLAGASAVSAAAPAYSYGAVAYVYDAPTKQLSPDTVASSVRGSPSGPEVASWGRSASVGGCCTAAKTEGGLVNIASPARTGHILDGEARPNGTFGGGHRAGTGFPGKSEFPATWSDAQVMHNISDVATDPSLAWRAGAKPGDFWVNGARDGIDIEVLIRNDEIWTGYPTNVARIP